MSPLDLLTSPAPARLDAALVEDLAVAWREAREDAALAYDGWRAAPAGRRRSSYAVFLAAADREDAASAAYLTARG